MNTAKTTRSERLTKIREACVKSETANREIWSLQDGYGVPGYTPVQGWDWSGIRDSSSAAIGKMFKVAEHALKN